MARVVTRSTLRDRIRQRANLESHTTFVTDAEVNDSINEVCTELYDMLVAQSPPDYYSAETTITTTSGTLSYALASDFYKLRAVWVDEGNGERRALTQFNEQEFQAYRPPDSVYSVIVRYIPNFTTLSSDGATIDCINGFDELLVLSAAIKLLFKDAARLDLLQLLQAERTRVEARIGAMSERNHGEVQRVLRRANRYADPYRTWTNNINAYMLLGGNIQLVRASGQYSV
jgi:hypothetical protein